MRILLTFVVLSSLSSLWAGCSRRASWAAVQQQIEITYPSVPQLSTDSLAAWLADPHAPQPLLLDVRTEAEYRVSHLRGARQVRPDADALVFLEDVPPDTPIVAYCSVGYRSSALAARLLDAGYSDVVSLRGSIFRWANEGRPIYREGHEVREVHPYNPFWGTLLDEELRVVD